MENVNVEKLNNPELLEKLKMIEDPDEFRAAVQAEGIDLDDALKTIAAYMPAGDEAELNEEELEDVAGGGWAIKVLKWAVPKIIDGVKCLKNNMRSNGTMRKCDCGLHKYAVRK